MRYDLATLHIRLGALGQAIPAIDAWSKSAAARGRLLGCWQSEVGEMTELTLFRGYEDDAVMMEERWRTFEARDPFGCGAVIECMRFDSYVPFPWMPPVKTGRWGELYEIRTYRLKPGGVPATIAAWARSFEERTRYSPLIMAMFAIDGPPRFTHIWPYRSFAERSAIRAEVVAKGAWPPKGAPDWMTGEISKTIAVPTRISPLG